MVKTILSSSVRGLFWQPVSVETDVSSWLPSFSVVGLGDTAVQESRERVRTAVRNSWYSFPSKRITVNLAPAEIRKAWPWFDLAIALGIVAEECRLGERDFSNVAVLGELALDGTVRSVGGIVAHAASLAECGITELVVPLSDAREAAMVPWIRAYGVESLRKAVETLEKRRNGSVSPAEPASGGDARKSFDIPDFSDISGQERAKRALEIAAAWWHNVLLEWAPGSGKTLLCRAFAGILPPVSEEEILTVAKIRSVAWIGEPFSSRRPFASVHPHASVASLLGGGPNARPWEITLAHLGTLFLDELREFPPYLLDALRQPLEDGEIRVSRALWSFTYPARFQLLAATNPCPCGYFWDREKPCVCAAAALERYKNRISWPMLDRMDLFVGVPRLSSSEIAAKREGKTSSEMLESVLAARAKQRARFGNSVKTNASMLPNELSQAGFSREAAKFAVDAVDRFGLSWRAHDRIRKVARTIADLSGSDTVETEHVAEAVGYRQR